MTTQTIVFPLSISTKVALNKKIIAISLLGIMLSLLAISIIQVNAYTKEMYTIKSYQKWVAELQGSNKMLEIDLSKANSFNNLGYHIKNQAFVKADKIEYIKVLGGTALAK
ncbi:MAG: hypothetical protein ABIA08_01485 [bacterium]